ncbi:tetratricopeptide repeat protein [Salegentibacter chungangensis]|uniref:Tetratricopeptide repeat protein n=1 Tax=Salegentibacter chungangensis TaxID=1335724 RepID=A0ABW3NLU7_9FLAO
MKNLIFYFLVLISVPVFSQNEKLFEEANAAYAEGNYQTAVDKYEQVLENGEASAELYYNLGNAHYKLNHIAPSIYNYEKALKLDPGNADAKNNIEFARNMTIDDIPVSEETGLRKMVNGLISVFSFNTWAKLAVLFSFLFVAGFIAYYFSRSPLKKRMFFAGSIAFLIICAGSVFFAFAQQGIQQNNQYGIVFSEEAPVRTEPNLRVDESFMLHEGTKARLLEDYQEWVKIELADGTQGWINETDLKKL